MIGLICAMDEEITLLRSATTNTKKESVGQIEFTAGKLSGKDVVLLRCGIGKVQAAVGCAMLIEKYKPSLVINTGSAGGVNPAGAEPLNFGDAVIASSLVYHDFDIRPFGYKLGQVPGRDTAEFAIEGGIVDMLEKAVAELHAEKKLPPDFKALPGLIASGDIFVSDSNFVTNLIKSFPQLRAVEMESTAVAHTCDLFNVPCMVLRCLSDIAGEESTVTFDEYLHVAAANSSQIVTKVVENY